MEKQKQKQTNKQTNEEKKMERSIVILFSSVLGTLFSRTSCKKYMWKRVKNGYSTHAEKYRTRLAISYFFALGK